MIGETISHYRILEKIGGGCMGVVYKEGVVTKKMMADYPARTGAVQEQGDDE